MRNTFHSELPNPTLTKPQVIARPNYVREYFQAQELPQIPEVSIIAFYEKLHLVRSYFLGQRDTKVLKENYEPGLPLLISESLLPNARNIQAKMDALTTESFSLVERELSEGNQSVYYGQMSGAHKQGFGLYAEYGVIEGQTRFYLYEGFFWQGSRCGMGLQWEGERIYIGQFLNNSPFSHTSALILYSSGDIYYGAVLDAKRHGRGAYFHAKPKPNQYYRYQASRKAQDYSSILLGKWVNDQLQPQAPPINKDSKPLRDIIAIMLKSNAKTLLIEQGSLYCGELLLEGNPVRQGEGIESFCNGDEYEGHYFRNRPQGMGRYKWAGGDEYVGEFRAAKRQGSGQWAGSNGQHFEGEYKDDKRNGYGLYRWPNGNVYQGQFKNDQRDGLGRMNWANGQTYLGHWKQGLQHGEGEVRINLRMSTLHKRFLFDRGAVKPGKLSQENRQKNNRTEGGRKHSLGELNSNKHRIMQSTVKPSPVLHSSFFQNRPPIAATEDNEVKQTRVHTQHNAEQQPVKMSKLAHKKVLRPHKQYKLVVASQKLKMGETMLRPIKWQNFKDSLPHCL